MLRQAFELLCTHQAWLATAPGRKIIEDDRWLQIVRVIAEACAERRRLGVDANADAIERAMSQLREALAAGAGRKATLETQVSRLAILQWLMPTLGVLCQAEAPRESRNKVAIHDRNGVNGLDPDASAVDQRSGEKFSEEIIQIDVANFMIRQRDREPLALRNTTPYRLLVYLYEHRHRAISHAEIIEKVWDGQTISRGAIHDTVSRLRRALEEAGIDAISIGSPAQEHYQLTISDISESSPRH